MPKVSVLMAVHNGTQFLAEAIESILEQSYADFEFIIVDDASTDESRAQIAAIADQRIVLLENEKRMGLTQSLNYGLEVARGKYVARMDHDDVALPGRLARQVQFLDLHEDTDVLGTWARTIGRDPEQTWHYPTEDGEIRSEFLFNSALVHSSVMLRKSTFDRLNLRYDPKVERAQDYELWTRAAPQIKFANIGQVLMRYRIHADQVGQQQIAEQRATADQVRERQLTALGLRPSQEELALHHRISRWDLPHKKDKLLTLESWFATLRVANHKSGIFPRLAFERVLARRWWAACRSNVSLGIEAWRMAAQYDAGVGRSEKAKLWMKSISRQLGWRR